MDDLLQTIWGHLDRGSFVLPPSDIARFLEVDLAALTTAGWLGDAPDSNSIICEHCNDVHLVEVMARSRSRGMRAVVYCPEAGLVAAPAERRRQKAILIGGVLRSISVELIGDAAPRCVEPDVTWEMGIHQFGDLCRPTYLVCGLGKHPNAQPAIAPDAVVFVPGAAMLNSEWKPAPTRIISIHQVMSWTNGHFGLDRDAVTRMVHRGASVSLAPRDTSSVVVSPNQIWWNDMVHELPSALSVKGQSVLEIVLPHESVPLERLVNRKPGALWRPLADSKHRVTVSSYLSRLGKKLQQAEPPINVRFSLPRGHEVVLRIFDDE